MASCDCPGMSVESLDDSLPEDYMSLSILSLLCCFPFGIPALIFSIKTRDANRCGDEIRAQRNSNMALILCAASILLGLLFILFTLSVHMSW